MSPPALTGGPPDPSTTAGSRAGIASSTPSASPRSTGSPESAGSPTLVASAATSGATTLADTWLWTATGWTLASAVGPPARSGGALAFDPGSGVPVLFGGAASGPSPAPPKLLADTWEWNGQLWQHLAPHASPPARDQAVMATDELTGGVVLFGGSGSRGDLGDTWLWDGTNWSAVRPAGSLSSRAGAASAFDATTRKLLVFGGVGPSGAVLGDTVMLSGAAPVDLGGGATNGSQPSTGAPNTGSGSGPSGPGATSGPGGSAATSTASQLPGHTGLAPGPGIVSRTADAAEGRPGDVDRRGLRGRGVDHHLVPLVTGRRR